MWTLPNLTFEKTKTAASAIDTSQMEETLTGTLGTLGVTADVVNTIIGPTTMRFELSATGSTKMRDFSRLDRASDLAYALGAQSVDITAPIPGRHVVGIEVTAPERSTVALGDVLSAAEAPLTAAIGVDIHGNPVGLNLGQHSAPHVLVAGRSGGGKSVLLHSILASLLTQASPAELGLVLADPKMTELTLWEGLPHLYGRVLVDVERIIDGLWWCVEEMETRYQMIAAAGCRDVAAYNASAGVEPLPYCLLVVDELADLMMQGRGEVESAIVRIGQKGRAAGVHMILATQSPRADVVTGLIKANLPARIALATSSPLDSRVILDRNGAEKLLGAGDLLLDDGVCGVLRRLQAPYTSPEDISTIVNHWKLQASFADRMAA